MSMPTALVFNPGSNSLKLEMIEYRIDQRTASAGRKLLSVAVDSVGKNPRLLVFDGREVASEEDIEASSMQEAVSAALEYFQNRESAQVVHDLAFAGVRVVHGGPKYSAPVRASSAVRDDIEALKDLAPLHNQNSLEILKVLDKQLPGLPALVAFDTSFHRSLPEKAWRYPIEREMADRCGIRKFGFHGLSHRYMLEHYASTIGKEPETLNVVTLHLESGCSACAIQRGQSIDTTMGLTPLEGLMMGSRSGSIDPAIIPYLMQKEHKDGVEILELLNRRSGILGIAGGSIDTRELRKRSDDAARLALEMFAYRVRLAAGAYLAALSDAEAVLFGGGIGEDSPWLREAVCAGLTGWGLHLDAEANRSTSGMCRVTTDDSQLHAWAVPVEEGLQLAHECAQAIAR